MQTQLRKGVLTLCILSVLKQKDSYAYEMIQVLNKYLDISEGTIYPLMSRLQKNKLVETYLKESPSGPARKFYRLSNLGHLEYDSMKEQWETFSHDVNNLLKDTETK